MTPGAPEPLWLIAANVVRWRRYGDMGQELRPGTKAYRGGAKVYVVGTYGGMGHEQLTTVGRGRHSARWITIDTATRHLHTFRAKLVYAPAVLRRAGAPVWATEEAARGMAELLDRVARNERRGYHGGAHPEPCSCHACLTGE
ncbi:hypothetical protein ACFPM3_13890 [Streptomyces coeruleoprunus]|uniref:Uncharacterized protein n=1 Tax=Streptomyces coeruleoprunus TaxID=285563 RepID=A0ABV9XG07_9ACTN